MLSTLTAYGVRSPMTILPTGILWMLISLQRGALQGLRAYGPVGASIIGVSVPIVGTVRVGIVSGIASALVQYVLAFVMVYVMALIIDALAPTFKGQKNQANALKLAVYSMTPVWLAGIFSLIPGLRLLSILGLYGLYLLWVGLPPLMKAPQEKSTGYAAAVVVCAIIISLVIGAIVGVFTRVV